MILVPSIDLLNHQRFDVTAKTLLLRFIDKGINSDYAKRVYEHHLKVWNGLVELNPRKVGLQSYLDSFEQLKKSIDSNHFDWHRSPIIVHNGNVINGSHRLACALHNNLKVGVREGNAHEGEACSYYHLHSYRNNIPTGLDRKYSDSMAIEFVRLCKPKRNVYVITVYPSAFGKEEQVMNIIKKHGNVVYDKFVNLNKTGGRNLVRQLYFGEAWLGGRRDRFGGGKQKSDPCFCNDHPTRFILVQANSVNNMVACKQEVRQLFRLGKHSVHINDTYEETVRIANLAFNDNSIFHMNTMSDECLSYNRFHSQLELLRSMIKDSNVDKEDVCIDSSSVMSAYGIKEGKDLDYLHHGDVTLKTHPDVTSHNNWAHHYTKSISEIVYNPENFFYYNDLKFANLSVVKDMKIKRNEEKDKAHVQLINSFLGKHNGQ